MPHLIVLRLLPAFCLLALAGLAAANALRTPKAGDLEVSRTVPARLSLGAEHRVTLAVRNLSGRRIHVEVKDLPPASLAPASLVPASVAPASVAPSQGHASWNSSAAHALELGPGATEEVSYAVRAAMRGAARFEAVHIRIRRDPGLVCRQVSIPVRSESRVYPAFLGVDQYDLLAMIDRRQEARRTPRLIRGQGSDFESLRAYQPGDDPRRIDWKVSAKRGTLTSRNLQIEKGQQLAILVDAGRFMIEPVAGMPRLEHALNAAVMLSYVAEKRGDSVSLACFSNRIESFMPPVQGMTVVARVLEALYDVRARNVESDYWHAFARVLSRLEKRSLVVLMSDVLDRAGSSGLMNNLMRAARKHLVLFVSLMDEAVYDAADTVPSDLTGSYHKAAAAHVLLERQLALDDMRARGILVLETPPRHFSIRLARRYLEVRKADLL